MERTAIATVVLSLLVSALLAARGGVPVPPRQFDQPDPAREVSVTGIPDVVAAGARWVPAWSGADNADGIVGTPDGGLLFAQEQPKRISKLDRDDKVSTYVANTGGAGSVGLDEQGRVYAAERTCTDPGLDLTPPCADPTRVAVVYPQDQRKVLTDNFQGKPLGRINDLVIARNGGVYFTSGEAFYVDPAGRVSRVGANLRTNGIMLSPDERILYVTNGATIVAFDVRPDGSVTNQRDFARLDAGGNGDGLAVDGAGRLYVTSNPGVQVFGPDGKYLGLIPTPRGAISVAFAGPDKKMLYVVGSGASGRDGMEVRTPPGIRNNAKSIFRLPMIAEGFKGRAK